MKGTHRYPERRLSAAEYARILGAITRGLYSLAETPLGLHGRSVGKWQKTLGVMEEMVEGVDWVSGALSATEKALLTPALKLANDLREWASYFKDPSDILPRSTITEELPPKDMTASRRRWIWWRRRRD